MKNLLKLICMAVILLTLTQCGKDSEPEPEPEAVTEIWQLTYDNYHTLVPCFMSKEEYKNLTHYVTIVRKEDELSIQGIFQEYPDAWTKFTIKDNKIYFAYPQTLGTDNEGTAYMHWGYVEYDYMSGSRVCAENVVFKSVTIPAAFSISHDGNTITAIRSSLGKAGGFWYNNNEEGSMGFYREGVKDDATQQYTWSGPDFPDEPYMINMVFTKVSDSKK